MPKFAKGNIKLKIKKNNSPGNLLIILYQLTKFEAPSCNSFFRYLDCKISFWPIIRGITPQREKHVIQTLKYWVSYFLMSNPFMKIQNPNFNFLNGHIDTSPKQYAPWTFSKLGA